MWIVTQMIDWLTLISNLEIDINAVISINLSDIIDFSFNGNNLNCIKGKSRDFLSGNIMVYQIFFEKENTGVVIFEPEDEGQTMALLSPIKF